MGSTGSAWRSTADRLDDRYRVHLVTVRGFGETDIGDNVGGGLAGRLYWLAVLPFHGFIFSGMANRITATAEAPEPS